MCLWPLSTPRFNTDVETAIVLTARSGLEICVIDPSAKSSSEWKKNRLTHHCSDEHAWYFNLSQHLNCHAGTV